jgi:hypothetical protein
MSILRELFHEDHQDTIHAMSSSSTTTTTTTTTTATTYSFGTNRHLQLHAVTLEERKSKFTKNLFKKLKLIQFLPQESLLLQEMHYVLKI